MRKLVCKKCGKAWYTANTLDTEDSMTCDDCGGKLQEVESNFNKSEYLKEYILKKR